MQILKSIIISTLIIIGISNAYSQNSDVVEKREVKTVVIDAGHGGKDPGALGKTTREKNLTLAIALKVGNLIKKNVKGVNVIYTREKDVFLKLEERSDIANKNNADLFISIHINSHDNSKIYGTRTYVNGTTRDKDNLKLQAQENGEDSVSAADYIERINIHTGNRTYALKFAEFIQNQFEKRAGRKNLKVDQACFAVIWRANMTAVLIECGFITNQDEEKYMKSEYGQDIISSAIYRAFKEYKNYMESPEKADSITLSQYSTPKITPKKEQPKKEEVKTDSSNKKVAQKDNTSNNNKTTDNKIYFRVQVKSNDTQIPLNSKEFKGLTVNEIKIGNSYKYTVGKTQNYSEIIKLQNECRKKIKDAFVIATKGNTTLNVNTAKKELGIK